MINGSQNIDLVAIPAGRSTLDSTHTHTHTHTTLSWTSWRKQLFLSYMQLVLELCRCERP